MYLKKKLYQKKFVHKKKFLLIEIHKQKFCLEFFSIKKNIERLKKNFYHQKNIKKNIF